MREIRPRVLAFVMAGGEGSRLKPLTQERCKPAVPFNGRHCIVDFVLSNLVNSEIYPIYLLVQYKSQVLIEHVREAWSGPRFGGERFISVVPPQMHEGPRWFQGTADAVRQNLCLIQRHQPDFVAVFGADHVYRMDVRQMLRYHIERQADLSVATLPVPLDQCHSFGIARIDEHACITGFDEKPHSASPMPGRPGHALASMGNYIFNTEVLVQALRCAAGALDTDFGLHVVPRLAKTHKVVAYDFTRNDVPGVEGFEEPAYWRDVGTIESYYQANFDSLGARPKLRLNNPLWPVRAREDASPGVQIENGQIARSVIGPDCVIDGAQLNHAILRQEVRVEADARLEHCIVMERSVVGRGARISRAIVDQDNHIPAGERIGYNLDRDRERFHVDVSGIVVVPPGTFPRVGAARN